MINTDVDKANLLANHFDSIWPDQHAFRQLLEPVNGGDIPPELLVDVWQIRKQLLHLDPKKSSGSDVIPSIFYKNCAIILAPALTVLINRTIRDGYVPRTWKESIICPVPKKGSLHDPANWRPINLLNIAAKVAESHIRQLVEPYILARLHPNQFGFISGRSTEDAILFAEQNQDRNDFRWKAQRYCRRRQLRSIKSIRHGAL
jgi:hypothetical protein